MVQAQSGAALLRPMRADSLIGPVAVRPDSGVPRVSEPPSARPPAVPMGSASLARSPYLRPAVLPPARRRPASVPQAVAPISGQRPQAAAEASPAADPLDGLELFAPDLITAEADTESPYEACEDAVPSASMPTPVCVPLYDLSAPVPSRRRWPWVLLGLAALLVALGFGAWHFALWPFFQ